MKPDSLFFRLLRFGLGTGEIGDWQLAMDNCLSSNHCDLSISHGVVAIIFDGLQKATEAGLLSADAVSREIKMKLFSHTMQVEALSKYQYEKAKKVAEIYAEHGIRTVVLKGITAGNCYPIPLHRPCGDLDCYLLGDYERGNEVARNLGAYVDSHSYKHSYIEYEELIIENHQFFTAHRGNKQMKRFERFMQGLLAEEGTRRIGTTHLESPSPLFNALFLTHHAREHVLLEGIALRHLCDWGMLLHKHKRDIDWRGFNSLTDEYGLRFFSDAMTCLAVKYLNILLPKEYNIIVDDLCVKVLESAIFSGIIKVPESKYLCLHRINKAIGLKKNDIRLRLFSGMSFTTYVVKQISGLLFDRNPQI